MQLILEPENTKIDINKMSAITEESTVENSFTNGLVKENNDDVPMINKESVQIKTNIIKEYQQEITLNNDKEIVNKNGDKDSVIEEKNIESNINDISCTNDKNKGVNEQLQNIDNSNNIDVIDKRIVESEKNNVNIIKQKNKLEIEDNLVSLESDSRGDVNDTEKVAAEQNKDTKLNFLNCTESEDCVTEAINLSDENLNDETVDKDTPTIIHEIENNSEKIKSMDVDQGEDTKVNTELISQGSVLPIVDCKVSGNNEKIETILNDEKQDVLNRNNIETHNSMECEEVVLDSGDCGECENSSVNEAESHNTMECDELVTESDKTRTDFINNSKLEKDVTDALMECEELITEPTKSNLDIDVTSKTNEVVNAGHTKNSEVEKDAQNLNDSDESKVTLTHNESPVPTENYSATLNATYEQAVVISENHDIDPMKKLIESLSANKNCDTGISTKSEESFDVAKENTPIPPIEDLDNKAASCKSNSSHISEMKTNDSEADTCTVNIASKDDVSNKCVDINFKNASEATQTKELNNDIEITEGKNNDVTESLSVPNNPFLAQNQSVDHSTASTAKNDPQDIVDVDNIKVIDQENIKNKISNSTLPQQKVVEKKVTPSICRLSNTLNILSDDEDEPSKEPQPTLPVLSDTSAKQCIDLEDDDDIMLIDEVKDNKNVHSVSENTTDNDAKIDEGDHSTIKSDDINIQEKTDEKDSAVSKSGCIDPIESSKLNEKAIEMPIDEVKSLLADDFLKSFKKHLIDMNNSELEEFCILKIVESITDRSTITELHAKLKALTQVFEETKKKVLLLTKQNRDLQVVLKSIQEEQRKSGGVPITPLKITRSVGMQVLMTDKNSRRKFTGTMSNANNGRTVRTNIIPATRPHTQTSTQQIPVPRLVPATNNSAIKPPTVAVQSNTKTLGKTSNPLPNGIRNSPPAPKAAEKRPRVQSVTVDLTDDEPPSKVPTKSSPAAVRLVNQQNLIAPRPQLAQSNTNSPRKVYIPISGPQGQNVRTAPAIMLKTVPQTGPRPRGAIAPMVRMPQNAVRLPKVSNGRHPAPLPDAMKQYQPPNWKALPPAPDLKLSKVENGIVISWKIDGYQEDSYEEIASYQLYAYQETTQPPSTSLWKKIGDVKALPLPMACTLTQFMAGYKYYFAVRAVDIRSRLGKFSLPGSILLINKM